MGFLGDSLKVPMVGVLEEGIPQAGRCEDGSPHGSAGLLKIVSQAVVRLIWNRLARAGADAGERSRSTPTGRRAVGEHLLQPVFSKRIPLLIY